MTPGDTSTANDTACIWLRHERTITALPPLLPQGYFYYIFGFLFLVAILTLVITVEVSIVCTYVQLCAEDYLWWWRSYYRGASIGIYVLLYSSEWQSCDCCCW